MQILPYSFVIYDSLDVLQGCSGPIEFPPSTTSGSDIDAYSDIVVYNFPDQVAGSDGYTYRCVGTNVLDDDPVGSSTGNWVNLSSVASTNLTGTPTAPTAAAGTNTTQIATTAFVQTAVVTAMPVGAIIPFAMSTPPTGYLECDGSAVSRTTYAALFTAISDDYGAGDGTTTFNLPDYRGQFLRGWAHEATTDPDKATRTDRGDGTGGDVVGSKQADAFKAHTHPIPNSNDSTNDNIVKFSGQTTIKSGVTGSTGGSETRPTNINVMYCIKY
jgi:microcystin-dependent protein